jgi:hypothetical protein
VFERGDASGARVAAPPWTTNFQTGFRAELGLPFLWILSFGNAKESISAVGPRTDIKNRRDSDTKTESMPHPKTKTNI